MNLNKLFEMQRVLDARIEKEHPTDPYEDRLTKRILAFRTELGELANELPEVFKFWSNKKNDMEKALKEYVDGLHFILSIGLDYYEDHTESGRETLEIITEDLQPYVRAGIEHQFETVYWRSCRIRSGQYINLFEAYLGLGKKIGFTWEQIEEAYLAKNAENHKRQESGY